MGCSQNLLGVGLQRTAARQYWEEGYLGVGIPNALCRSHCLSGAGNKQLNINCLERILLEARLQIPSRFTTLLHFYLVNSSIIR